MKILYDHQAFLQRFGGISRYQYELAKGLMNNNHEVEISIIFSQNEYILGENTFKIINPIGHKKFKGGYRIMELFNSFNKQYSIYNIKKGKYDIFHPTYYSPYFLENLHKPFVITVHDFIHEKFQPEMISEITNKKLLIEKADKIIAISENTKSDILSYYSIPEEKISVVHHGYNNPKNNFSRKNIYGNYILFVGKRDGYKNFAKFLLATSHILLEDRTLKVICTGDSFSKNELAFINELQISERIIQVYANDQLLNTLYKNAKVFVYPSLYEGFGMPILEAFANNCPICISNTSSLPEIAQEAALYFNPYDENSIYNSIKNILYNEQLRKNLIRAGQIRLLDFSWKKTIQETIEVYKKLL